MTGGVTASGALNEGSGPATTHTADDHRMVHGGRTAVRITRAGM